ncbi:Mobile element protein [hydrothermal vent metagenome]|uniref:Mobile element protein n=1 Tax=hydrothermal vent metagenome TaxID=652676 RepID=A0A3B1B869_9ZZZZ
MSESDIKAQVEAQLAQGSCAASELIALQVIGDSMEPEFKDGAIIVIDQDAVLRDRVYVLAVIEGGMVLRQLFIENEQYYVQPLNEDYMHERQSIDKNDLKGVIVQQTPPKGRRKDRITYNYQ